MIGRTIGELAVGDVAEIQRRVDPATIAEFVDVVGDRNPLHSDPGYAATTPFGEPIAPGIFTAGLISAVIGTQLPGPGAVYLSQTLKFLKPVRMGDTITARVEVAEVARERNRIRLLTVCRNQHGEEVLTGEAWVMPAQTPVRYTPAARTKPAAVGLWALAPWAWAAQAVSFWSAFSLRLLRAVTSAGRH